MIPFVLNLFVKKSLSALVAADALLYIVFTQHGDERALYETNTDATEQLRASLGNVVNGFFQKREETVVFELATTPQSIAEYAQQQWQKQKDGEDEVELVERSAKGASGNKDGDRGGGGSGDSGGDGDGLLLAGQATSSSTSFSHFASSSADFSPTASPYNTAALAVFEDEHGGEGSLNQL